MAVANPEPLSFFGPAVPLGTGTAAHTVPPSKRDIIRQVIFANNTALVVQMQVWVERGGGVPNDADLICPSVAVSPFDFETADLYVPMLAGERSFGGGPAGTTITIAGVRFDVV